MTLDGLVMVTDRDNFVYHEMMSHPALFTHPDPQRVLIIGGGDCGTLHEVLKHTGVELAEQVELDERVTRVAEKFFPELCESNNDPRARCTSPTASNGWRKPNPAATTSSSSIPPTRSARPPGCFPNPSIRTASARWARGVVVGQSESPLFHAELIVSVQRSFKAAGFRDVATLFFPQCTYPSGWWSATLACKDGAPSRVPPCRRREKPFPTRYYNAAIHTAALAAPEFLARPLHAK